MSLEKMAITALHILAAYTAAHELDLHGEKDPRRQEELRFGEFKRRIENMRSQLGFLDAGLIEETMRAAERLRETDNEFRKLEGELKRLIAEHVSKEYRPRYYNIDCSTPLARALATLYDIVILYKLKLESRGVLLTSSGLLYPVFEIGVPLHPVLDTLYIPASILKGALRATLLKLCISTNRNNKGKLRKCIELVYTLLGSSDELAQHEYNLVSKFLGVEEMKQLVERIRARSSCIHLSDALLAEAPGGRVFEPWVITPHYRATEFIKSEYDAKPTPVIHVVLRPELVFAGLLAVKGDCIQALNELRELVRHPGNSPEEVLVGILARAARNGVGARTARGYSIFQVVHAELCKR